ncbi:MAG: hypothetical protein ACTS22_06365 [Phycisphaerales bacterium]
MTLRTDILAWDGRSADDIAAVFDRHAGSRGFAGRLIGLAEAPALERGATWLLKRALERGDITLTADQAQSFYAMARSLSDWGACLHLMQCVPFVPIPRASAPALARMLDRLLSDRRAIVRAWAYWGYHELALAHPRYRAEAESLLRDATESESAGSVRVRVRLALEARGLA